MTPTYCTDCDHVDPQSRKQHPRMWLCLKHPCLQGAGFVARDIWTSGEPFLRCRDVNGGHCHLFSPRRDAGKEAV